MSIVSGLATAPGISALLNAPRESASPLRVVRGDPVATAAVAREEVARRPGNGVQTPRAVVGPDRLSETPPPQIRRESSDPRYLQFVDAVTALRIDLSEETLTKSRVAELRDAARAVFRMEGVPEDRRPDPVDANASDNRERVQRQQDKTEQRRLEATAAKAERSEAAKRALAEADERRLAEAEIRENSPAQPVVRAEPAAPATPDLAPVARAEAAPRPAQPVARAQPPVSEPAPSALPETPQVAAADTPDVDTSAPSVESQPVETAAPTRAEAPEPA